MAKTKKAKSKFFARLTVHDFQDMKPKHRAFFVKWLRMLATEMKTAKPKDYSNPFRATLFKF